ncbi:hypothetical protein C2S51_015943 [Perilla frutescens var. frutescens]|nr:hypothetical protein C2S51_015943 [Perilla frutescens var. frutescens]
MAQIPHQLIRQVQIRTRAAAGLPDYDPSDPTLPALPPLSATIAASDADASPPHRRCRNCKALLLRGSESIVCLYCGLGPHYDAIPDPICFTSTIGYQWLLRSLRLDGSEMVDPASKSKQDKSQSSPKDLTPLSVFLNFNIPWPAEIVNGEISSDEHLEESKRSLILTGVSPDRFFLKSKSIGVSDTLIEQPSDHKWVEAASTKDVAALDDQDLFQNVRSSKPAASSSENKTSEALDDQDLFQNVRSSKPAVSSSEHKTSKALDNQDLFQNVQSSKPAISSSEHKTSEALSGWEADFQSADSENQHGDHTSSKHVTASSEGSEIEFQDPESFQSSSDLNVDLAAHLDSVFGPGEDLNDGKPNDSPSVPAASGDWNSDDMWNNLTSSAPNLSDGFYATFSTKSGPQNDHTLDYSKDLSTNDDLFQDFHSQTNNADTTGNKTTNEDLFDWNDFASSTSVQAPSQNAWAGSNDQVSTSEDKPLEGDFFRFDNTLEVDKSSEGDLFSFNNKFEGDKKSSEGDVFSFDTKFEDDKKSIERDLFSFDSNFGGDFSGCPQPNLFSTSTSNINAPTEGNAILSENSVSNWFSDAISPSLESGQAANNGDAFGQSTKDDVKMLISQMHDLSFMLETDLSIPSSSDDHESVHED